MNEVTRLFDFFYFQLKNFPKADMLTSKVNGKWAPLSTQDVSGLVNRLSAGLMKLGLSGNDMTVEKPSCNTITSNSFFITSKDKNYSFKKPLI